MHTEAQPHLLPCGLARGPEQVALVLDHDGQHLPDELHSLWGRLVRVRVLACIAGHTVGDVLEDLLTRGVTRGTFWRVLFACC